MTVTAYPERGGLGTAQSSSKYSDTLLYKGSLNRWKAALARGAAAPARMLILADSNGSGYGAAGSWAGARLLCWPILMAKALGWQCESHFGDPTNTGASLPTYDPRFSSLGSWTIQTTNATLGGRHFVHGGTPSGDLLFTPDGQWDSLRVWYSQLSLGSSSSCDIKIDGAVAANITSYKATEAFVSQLIQVPKGTHQIALQAKTTGNLFVDGFEVWDSTNPAPVLLQASYGGAKITELSANASPFNPAAAVAAVAPDAVMLHCTINDLWTSVAANTIAAASAKINRLCNVAGADVINTVSFPFNHAGVTDGRLDGIAKSLLINAQFYDGAFADARAIFGGEHTIPLGDGLVFDNLHLRAAGYAKEADFFKGVVS